MAKRIDMTGKTVGRWTVLHYVSDSWWMCRCSCGVIRSVCGAELRRMGSLSCGCLRVERAITANTKHGQAHRTRAYTAWANMIKRCSPTAPTKDRVVYADRGIKVCRRWLRFENFFADMGEPPVGMSLDRKVSTKGYTPSNCRWATAQQQAHNSRVTKLSDSDIRKICASAQPYKVLADKYGVSVGHITKVRSGKFYPRTAQLHINV